MRWRAAGKESCRRHIEWLKKDEWRHAALSARLRDAGGAARFGRAGDGRLWVRESEGRTRGGIYCPRFGVLLPAFNPRETSDGDERFIAPLVRSRRDRLFSIIGTEERVRFIENFLDDAPVDSERYRLFTAERLSSIGESRGREGEWGEPLTIRAASPGDFQKLWPLERHYQMEEVIRSGREVSEYRLRELFRAALKRQSIYMAIRNGEAVGKAGTNARGFTYDQVGGVFVTPKYRRRGIAAELMRVLMNAIHRGGRGACLFVKESNSAALNLYRGLGLGDRGGFRISYWS